MKDYKEMAESVYSAVREENFRKAKRAGIIRKAVPCCCICGAFFAAAIVMGNWGKNVNLNPENYYVPNAAPEESTADETDVKYQYEFEGRTDHLIGDDFTEDEKAEEQPAETTDKFVQIGWMMDAEGNTYPATVERDQEPSDADLISYGVKPSHRNEILNALNYCFDEKTEGVTDYENVRVVTFAPEKYYEVYVECGKGEEIYALEDGKVISTGWGSSAGNHIMVINDKGNVISYCNLSNVNAEKGDSVTAGQVVGFAGNSGIAHHIGTTYMISSFEDALSIYAHNVSSNRDSFSDNVPANSGISAKETKTIYDALIESNSKNTGINPDRLEMNVTLDNGIEVRIFGYDDAALLLNTEEEEEVYALTGGEIVSIGSYGENGHCIDVLTDNGEYLTYCHLGEISEEINRIIESDYSSSHHGLGRIEEGQLLGKAGKFEGESQSSVLYSIRAK